MEVDPGPSGFVVPPRQRPVTSSSTVREVADPAVFVATARYRAPSRALVAVTDSVPPVPP